jgi:hypothetical protein
MAKKAKKAKKPAYEFMCTRAQKGCIKWLWVDADQWWTKYDGPCSCSDCHGFLDDTRHALALADALDKARAE